MRVCLGLCQTSKSIKHFFHLQLRDQQISEKLSCRAQNMILPRFWVRPGSETGLPIPGLRCKLGSGCVPRVDLSTQTRI